MAAIAAGALALSSNAATSSHHQLTEQQILRIALRAAARQGDPRPTLIQHSEGTRCAANRIMSGACFGGSAWSYLIAERGHFIGYGATVPAGASLPRGTVITLIVNATTGQGTDGGISYRYPPLAQLGPVTTDFRSYLSCPVRDRQQLVSTTTGAGKELVPPGARQVLVCRYGGLNAGAAALRLVNLRLVVGRNTVTRFASEFDALKPFQGGVYSCPADFDAKIIAIFRYLPTPQSDDPVTVDTSGCTPVTNGHLIRTAAFAPGPALVQQLEALTSKRS